MGKNVSIIFKITNKITDDLKKDNSNSVWNRLHYLADDNGKYENEFLDEYMSDSKKKHNMGIVDCSLSELKSYYRTFQDGYIYLFAYSINNDDRFLKYILAIQSKNDANIIELNDFNTDSEDVQSELLRVTNLIQRQIDNVDGFLNDFLDDGEDDNDKLF